MRDRQGQDGRRTSRRTLSEKQAFVLPWFVTRCLTLGRNHCLITPVQGGGKDTSQGPQDREMHSNDSEQCKKKNNSNTTPSGKKPDATGTTVIKARR